MGNCTGMFSQAFFTVTRHTSSSSFVPSWFTLYKAPFSASEQSLYSLDKTVMSHLLISVQLAHLAQAFHSWNVAPQKTCSCSSCQTAFILSQHSATHVSRKISLYFPFSFIKNFKCVNKEDVNNLQMAFSQIFQIRKKHMQKVLILQFSMQPSACCDCYKLTNPKNPEPCTQASL